MKEEDLKSQPIINGFTIRDEEKEDSASYHALLNAGTRQSQNLVRSKKIKIKSSNYKCQTHNIFCQSPMQESPVRVDKKLVRVTAIPVQIYDDPTQLTGLVRFSTQSSAKPLSSVSVTTRRKKNLILYRNQVENQEEQAHQRRGKEIQLYEAFITSQRYRNKRFKVEIPIVKGYKSSRQLRGNELHFTFSFSNSGGVLDLMNGQYQAKSEFTGRDNAKQTDRDKLQRQLARLDNRKREELNMDIL